MNSLTYQIISLVAFSICCKISKAEEDIKPKGDLNLAVFVILSQNHPRHATIGNQVKQILFLDLKYRVQKTNFDMGLKPND